MSCSGNVLTVASTVVYSVTTTGILHPVSGPYATTGINAVRPSFEVLSRSPNATVQLGYQLSNDGSTWYDDAQSPTSGAYTLFTGTQLSQVDVARPAAFVSIPQNANAGKRYLRFVVLCTNSSGTATELATITATIETRLS